MRKLTPCGQSSVPAIRYQPTANVLCSLDADHEGNHSWAPADLAPSPLKVQREAYAADQAHAAKTSADAPHIADGTHADYLADPDERIELDEHRHTFGDGCGVEEQAKCQNCATPIYREEGGRWVHVVGKSGHGIPLVDPFCPLVDLFRKGKAPATATPVRSPHERYGADERWTYVGPGGLFRLAGGDGAIDVYAIIVTPSQPGRFRLTMLGHLFGPIERDVDGVWREVFGDAERCGG